MSNRGQSDHHSKGRPSTRSIVVMINQSPSQNKETKHAAATTSVLSQSIHWMVHVRIHLVDHRSKSPYLVSISVTQRNGTHSKHGKSGLFLVTFQTSAPPHCIPCEGCQNNTFILQLCRRRNVLPLYIIWCLLCFDNFEWMLIMKGQVSATSMKAMIFQFLCNSDEIMCFGYI